MKVTKRLLGFCLTFFLVIPLSFASHTVVNASGYVVNISLGNNQFAEFNSSAASIGNVSADGRKLTLKNVATVSEIESAITIKPDPSHNNEEKYVFDGLRVSGNDDKYTGTTIPVDCDQTYVVAYKICKIVPYTVEYRLKTSTGNTMDKEVAGAKASDTLYGAVNEKVTVPAQEIEGYVPDANSKYLALADSDTDNKVIFTYSRLEEKITYQEITDTKYIYGNPTYTYTNDYVDGGTTVRESTTPGRTVVSNRREGSQTTTAGTAGNGAGEAGGAAGGATNGEGGGDADITTIGDGETPLAGEGETGTSIPDPEPPKRVDPNKKGGISLISRVVVTVTIITLITLVIITFVTYIVRRRNYK